MAYSEAATEILGPATDPLKSLPVPEDEVERLVDNVFATVRARVTQARADDGELGLDDFGAADIPAAAGVAMEIAETTIMRGVPLTGPQKKGLVLRVAGRLAAELVPEGPARDAAIVSVRVVLPGLIDLVVRASRGGVVVNTWLGALQKRCCFLRCGCGEGCGCC